MIEITERDFADFRWDCDICPLFPCPGLGTMSTDDCYDDVMAFWKRKGIAPSDGFTQAITLGEEEEEE